MSSRDSGQAFKAVSDYYAAGEGIERGFGHRIGYWNDDLPFLVDTLVPVPAHELRAGRDTIALNANRTYRCSFD